MDFLENDFTQLFSIQEIQQDSPLLFSGSSGGDSLLGSENPDTLVGFSGNDTIHALSEDDWLIGDEGDDWLSGNLGRDTLNGGTGKDILYGGKDSDLLLGNEAADWLAGNRESDTLYGGEDDDLIYGGRDNDLLFGNPGDDTLFGDKGSDTLNGGGGVDLFVLNLSVDSAGAVETDFITDFQPGEDLIDFADNSIASTLVSENTDDGDVVIQIEATGETVAVIEDVDTDVFDSSSFVDGIDLLFRGLRNLSTDDTATPAYPGYLFQYQPGGNLSYDSNVELWQQRMQDLGFEIEVDGFYGFGSARIARQFQQATDLSVDGIVGPEVWKTAFEVTSADLDIDADNGTDNTPYDIAAIINSPAVDYSIGIYAEESIPIILNQVEKFGITDPAQVAYILATADHESLLGKYMEEIASGDAYEWRSDLGNNQPGDGRRFKGRGYVQITGRANYIDWSNRLNLDLVGNPDIVTNPDIAATILVEGMLEGTFTGRRLSDYINSSQIDFVNARRIINGTDRASRIAQDAERYYAVLTR
ncbi:MAG: peptidoglycan-binding protein [Microcoleaceae cyanobacterium]